MEVGWWALLVAAGSLALSAATFWRNRTPTPRWDLSVTVQPDGEHHTRVQATAVNRGKGVAREVRFEPDWGFTRIFGRQDAEQVAFGEALTIDLVFKNSETGTGDFELSWYAEPRLHRRRRKTARFELGSGTGPVRDGEVRGTRR